MQGRIQGSAAKVGAVLLAVMAGVSGVAGVAVPAVAQDVNIPIAASDAEARLARMPFELLEARPIRAGDMTRVAALGFADSVALWVKWDPAPRRGAADNNEPRYQIGAYEFQKLFLPEPGYVVPPTVARVFPLAWLRERDLPASATFGGAASALVVLQLWLQEVTASGVWDPRRFEADPSYARHVGNLNVLTYLIRHADSNTGNVLISRDPSNPRVFSVDNGIAFTARANPAAHEWMEMRVPAIPRETADRLRSIRREELDAVLGVVVQLERRDGELAVVEPGENLDPRRRVRERDGVIQLGLTRREIDGVEDRLRHLLRQLERGAIGTF